MTAPTRLLGAALLLAAAAGCDFTPTLDVETPDYEAGLALRSFLVADSVAAVWVSGSWDPYEGRSYGDPSADLVEADVALYRDGQLVERLTARRDSCVDPTQPPVPPGGTVRTVPCGPYAGTVPIEAGATYTVRAEADGWEPVEATATVPVRPDVRIVEEAVGPAERRRFRVELRDPSGAGDLYGLSLYRWSQIYYESGCDETGCRDTTYVVETGDRFATSYETSDPVLIAGAREFDDDVSFASFSDDAFDGRTKTFTISPSANYAFSGGTDGRLTVQLAALSADLYDAYQIATFSGGDDNPFAEPINRPSNVEGGYGIVGGLALAEVTFEARAGAARR